jgi:hypothetical protein
VTSLKAHLDSKLDLEGGEPDVEISNAQLDSP